MTNVDDLCPDCGLSKNGGRGRTCGPCTANRPGMVFQLQANYGYGHGWEPVGTEATNREAKIQQEVYRTNQPQYRFRVRRVKEET